MLQRHSSKQSRGEESLIASLEMFGGVKKNSQKILTKLY